VDQKKFKSENSQGLVYEETNNIDGFITLVTRESHAEIGLIAVNPLLRGQGIGTELIKHTITEAYTLGYKTIKVVTQLENKAAISLYNKSGFEIEDITYVYHYWNI